MSDTERIRIVGTIRSVVRAPVQRWAVIDGVRLGQSDAGELLVDTSDGPIRVTIATHFLLDGASEERWSEVDPTTVEPSAIPAFADAKAQRLETLPARGTPIAVYGEVTSRGFIEDGGHREAPSERITGVDAILATLRDDVVNRLDELIAAQSWSKKKKKKSWWPF